jgi:serine/threonine protein kinase
MERTDSIMYRLAFIQKLLEGKTLEPLIDFDSSEPGGGIKNDDMSKGSKGSNGSYSTRVVLKKKIHNFENIIGQLGEGEKIMYIKSGSTGHTFKGTSKGENGKIFEYAVKVVAYPRKERYGPIINTKRPENAELMMIKLLSYFSLKKQTPHIVLPIGTFDTDIETFVNLVETDVIKKNNLKYKEFVKMYKKGGYHSNVSILISEWANRGDLLDFIRKGYKNFEPMHWKVFLFQIISTLAVIQSKYPTFRHNDMKANNILVHKIDNQAEKFSYKIVSAKYKVPNIGYQIKLWDFDFACIPGIIDNIKVESKWTVEINVTPEQNKYYDLHYFFNTLIKKGFFSEILTEKCIPQEVKDFINRIVPPKYQKPCGPAPCSKKGCDHYVHERGRLLINHEYTTPNNILKYDTYFEEFRVENTP